jgi:hypothetical protein
MSVFLRPVACFLPVKPDVLSLSSGEPPGLADHLAVYLSVTGLL